MSKERWYKLDNAAQLFPIVSSKKETNSFRLSAVLKEDIEPLVLKKALKTTLERFPTFKVKLKKGFFWYYLEENNKDIEVKEESPYLCEANNYQKQGNYLFKVCYFGKRISLEIFHVITDGGGGMEFFKSLLFNYLTLQGYSLQNHGEILTSDVEMLVDEAQDSFKYNYDKKTNQKENESKGFTIKGLAHTKKWTGCISAICDVDDIKKAAKKYDATITEYISALLIYSIYINYYQHSGSTLPIRLFIPVNARRFFDSKTLRNFALFIRTNTLFTGDITLEQVIEHVKETFKEEIKKDELLGRIKTNVKLETNIFTRCIPLFIKQFVVKMVYRVLGSEANTLSYSNLGVVSLPEKMSEYIDHLEFLNDASKYTPINVGSVTMDKYFVLSFTSDIIERKLQTTVIRMLQKDEVSLVVETNDLEVE